MTYMNILQVFLLLFLFLPIVHSKNHCLTSYCPNQTLPIRYPFKLHDQPTQNCSYTNLRCSSEGKAILNLPHNGDFCIRNIDYANSAINLYDPQNCLPKRLMSFNISSVDPAFASFFLNYTFYSCPPELIALSNFTATGCLSNASVATVATHTVSSLVMKKLYRCDEIVTSSIPVTFDPPDFIGDQSDLILIWFAPDCENCYSKTRGLVPGYVLAVAFLAMSFLTVIMPFVISMACCVDLARVVRKEVKSNRSNVT